MEKEINISKFGSYDVLELKEKTKNNPKANEVSISVKACGINFADILMRVGLYPDAPKLPFSPGYEVSGVIERIGSEVTNFNVGDRVVAVTYFGGYTTYAVAESSKTRLIPDNMTFIEAAAIPVNFLTAYISLNEMARIRRGDHVLIHGASGGVGLAAVQMAKQKECVIYGTAGSEKKLDFIKDLGVNYPINYLKNDFIKVIKDITGKKRSIDVIIDPIGGKNISANLSILKSTGRTVVFGVSEMLSTGKKNYFNMISSYLSMRKIDTLNLIENNMGIFGLNVLKMWDDDNIALYMDNIINEFAQNNYKVYISDTFPLEDVGSAHKYIQERKNIGKVVLTV